MFNMFNMYNMYGFNSSGGIAFPPYPEDLIQHVFMQYGFMKNTDNGYWESIDQKGNIDKIPEPGRCYDLLGTETASGFDPSETFTYFDGTSEQTITSNSSGVISFPAGKFGFMYRKSGDDYVNIYPCDDDGSLMIYDCVSKKHALKSGFISANHVEDISFRSLQNEFGYNTYAVFNGLTNYGEYENSGLGSGTFYYKYIGTIPADGTTCFSDGNASTGGKRLNVGVYGSSDFRFDIDDNSTNVTTIMIPSGSYNVGDLVYVTIERDSDFNVSYVCNNLTDGNAYSGVVNITSDYSSTQTMTIGAYRSLGGSIGSYGSINFELLEIGSSKDNIIHRYYKDDFTVDTIGSNNATSSNDGGFSYVPLLYSSSFVPENKDSLGNETVDFFGRTKNNVKIVNNTVAKFDGIDDYIELDSKIELSFSDQWTIAIRIKPDLANNYHLVSDDTAFTFSRIFVDSSGYLSITTVGNSIYFSNLVTVTQSMFWCYYVMSDGEGNLILSNGSASESIFVGDTDSLNISSLGGIRGATTSVLPYKGSIDYIYIDEYIYKIKEGKDAIIYDCGQNKNNGTVRNAILTSFWDFDEKSSILNLSDGFDLWQNDSDSEYLRIPFDTDGNSIKTDGDTVTGYTWVAKCLSGFWHNFAESKYINYEVPELYKADGLLTTRFLFQADGTPNEIGYGEIDYNEQLANVMFANIEDYRKRNLLTYRKVMETSQVSIISKYTKNNIWNDEGVWNDTLIWFD